MHDRLAATKPARTERVNGANQAGVMPRASRDGPGGDHPSRPQPALSRLLATTIHPKLRASAAGDPSETQADRVADALTYGSAGTGPMRPLPTIDRSPPAEAGLSSNGSRLPADLSRDFGGRLERELSGVRIHDDVPAAATADALGARAFTVGHDIGFASGEYAPTTSAGRKLIAHELAHVVQPARTLNVAFRQPVDDPFGGPPVMPEPRVYGPDYEQDLVIDEAPLPGHRKRKQTFRMHLQVDGPRCDIQFWIVPVRRLKLPTAPPPSTAPVTPPPTPPVPPGTQSAPAPSSVQVVAHPAVPPGSTVQTIDGGKLTALASNPTHVITAEYSKFAVGAGSTSALKLRDGSAIIIDAGVNSAGFVGDPASKLTAAEQLAELTIKQLEAFIGKNALIRDLLISHAHGDHMSLAPAIMRKFAVAIVRINDVMRRWKGAAADRQAMKVADQERIAEAERAFRHQIEGQRALWEEGEGSAFAPDAREAEWDKHIGREFEKTPQSKPATERVLVQTEGNVLDVIDFDLATGERRGPVPFSADDPYAIAETQREASHTRQRYKEGERPPSEEVKDQDIDKYASAFVVTVKGGMSLLVLPDLRAKDLSKIKARFAEAMGHVKRPFQIWDATHHMQKGWYNIEGRVPATQLGKLADFLMTFRSAGDADAVVVSAQLDVTRPEATTLVDPVAIRFLRSLGFEVYLAASGQQIRVIDITTTQGTKLTGILNTKAPGIGDPKLTARRATLALEKLAAERQARTVAANEELDPVKKAEIKRRIAEIETLETQLKAAFKDALTELEARLRAADPHTTRSLSQPQTGDFPKQRALDEWLEQHGFDLPVVKDMHLTEMAMVILDRPPDLAAAPPGSPGARARRLAEVRSRINELGLRSREGGMTPEIQQELLVEFQEYQAILENELNPADPAQKPIEGTTKELLTADLAEVKTRIAGLTEGPGTTEFSRTIGKGDLVAQHATVIKPLEPAPKVESPTMRGARGVAEAAGRVGGVVMVATTVTGEGDLMKRWREGKATSAEAAVGTVKNVGSAAVGVLMLRGVNVHPAAFVVIAILEVSEAALRHYDTEEQRDIGVLQAAASSAVNLGCMGLGMGLMAIPTPITFIGGLIISTIGPLILKALGVDEKIAEWAERHGAFNPPDVVEVLQTLRKLLKSYQIVVGTIQLAKRAKDPADPTFARLPDVAERAEQVRIDESARALNLEQDILSEFKSAYEDAKTNYAGLKDLDDYRAQFYYLRQQAGLTNVANVYGRAVRGQTADETFKAIDATMSIESLSADDIRRMPQWSHIDSEMTDFMLMIHTAKDDEDHAKVRDKDKRIQAMIDNARYRLNPSAQSRERLHGLLRPDSPAGKAYEAELVTREANHAFWRRRYLERTSPTGQSIAPGGGRAGDIQPWPLTPDWSLSMLEGTIKAYRDTVEQGYGPPHEMINAMWTHADGAELYRSYVKHHDLYRDQLAWLQTTEQMIDGQISQAKRTRDAEPKERQEALATRLQAAVTSMKEARTMRFSKFGMVYLSELDALRTNVWKDESEKAQALFDAKDRAVKPFTEEQELALVAKKGDFDSDLLVRPPLSRRLQIVRSPTAVDRDGNLANIFRLTGDVPINLPRGSLPTVAATPAMNALVGRLAAPHFEGAQYENSPFIEVFPLNDQAITIFKRDQGFLVYPENLAPISSAELERAEEALKTKAPVTNP